MAIATLSGASTQFSAQSQIGAIKLENSPSVPTSIIARRGTIRVVELAPVGTMIMIR
jgi:hypothetical protein